MWPPLCVMIPYTVASPSPVPLPGSLVMLPRYIISLLIGIGDRYDRIKALDLGHEMPPEAIKILELHLA